jgi:hypothetical protein
MIVASIEKSDHANRNMKKRESLDLVNEKDMRNKKCKIAEIIPIKHNHCSPKNERKGKSLDLVNEKDMRNKKCKIAEIIAIKHNHCSPKNESMTELVHTATRSIKEGKFESWFSGNKSSKNATLETVLLSPKRAENPFVPAGVSLLTKLVKSRKTSSSIL